jgi:hypothetical protein
MGLFGLNVTGFGRGPSACSGMTPRSQRQTHDYATLDSR